MSALAAARTAAGPPRRRLLRAHALLHREGGEGARARAARRCPSTARSACAPTASTSHGRLRGRRDGGHDLDHVVRSDAGDRRPRRRRLAARRRRLRGLGLGLSELRCVVDGIERADSLVVNPHKWLFPARLLLSLDGPLEDSAGRSRLVPEYLRSAEDVVSLSDSASRSAGRFARSSSGRCCAATAARACRRIREHVRLAERFEELGARRARLSSSCAPRPFSFVCFRLDGSDEENDALLGASTRAARSSSRNRARRALRAALRGRQRADDRGRRGARWDVLRREAAAARGPPTRAPAHRIGSKSSQPRHVQTWGRGPRSRWVVGGGARPSPRGEGCGFGRGRQGRAVQGLASSARAASCRATR